MKRRVVLVTIALVIVLPRVARGQVGAVVGVALMPGTMQTPYIFNCDENPKSHAVATTLYAGPAVGAVSVTAGYLEAREWDFGLECRIPPPRADGTHLMREFPRRTRSFWGWAFHLRFTPQKLPLFAYIGTGFEFEGNRLRTIGAGIRTRGSLTLFGAGEITQLRTPYVDYTTIWQNGEQVSKQELTVGHEWRNLRVIRLGVEYRLNVMSSR